jgi:hypothetical protein
MSTATTQRGAGISELDSRSANGIDVALVWQHRENTAVVVVVDHRTGENMVVEVGKDDSALDVFRHPYAYAAHRRIDHGSTAALA